MANIGQVFSPSLMTIPRDFGPFMTAAVHQPAAQELSQEMTSSRHGIAARGGVGESRPLFTFFTLLTLRLVTGIHGVILQAPLEAGGGGSELQRVASAVCCRVAWLIAHRTAQVSSRKRFLLAQRALQVSMTTAKDRGRGTRWGHQGVFGRFWTVPQRRPF